MSNKIKPSLILLLTVLSILIVLALLVRSGRLPNPVADLEPENAILSTVVGKINDILSNTDKQEENEEALTLEEKFARTEYPAELFSFDVTSQKVVFGIVSVSPTDKTMVLRYIFPFDRQDKVIKSVINCPIEESVVTYLNQENQPPETVPAKEPLYEIADVGTDTLLGICGDYECSSIERGCELQRTK